MSRRRKKKSNVQKTLPDQLRDSRNNPNPSSKPDRVIKENIEGLRLQDPEFTVEIGKDVEQEKALDDAWAWADGRGEVAVQPNIAGWRGILERQGSAANLRFKGNPPAQVKNLDWKLQRQVALETDKNFTAEVLLCFDGEGNHKFFLIDLMFWGDSIVEQSYSTRREELVKFANLNKMADGDYGIFDIKWITSNMELQEAIDWAFAAEGSEGALLKTGDGEYPTKFKSADWYKILKGKEPLVTPIEKQFDETTLLAAAALGYKVEEMSEEKVKGSIEKEKKSNEKIKASILKADEDKQFVLGVVSEPLDVDIQEDISTPDDIEQTAHDFLANHRVIGFRHRKKADAVVVESYIAPVDFKVGNELVKKGSWLLGVIIKDTALWKDVKDGKINGFSVGGFGEREELE